MKLIILFTILFLATTSVEAHDADKLEDILEDTLKVELPEKYMSSVLDGSSENGKKTITFSVKLLMKDIDHFISKINFNTGWQELKSKNEIKKSFVIKDQNYANAIVVIDKRKGFLSLRLESK